MSLYAARNGQNRAYPTSAQAVAYERAYAAHPAQPWGLPQSPAIDGYWDAQTAADAITARATAAHVAAHHDHRQEDVCTA